MIKYQVIDLERQLKYFEQVRKSLTEKLGVAKAEEVISEAVYFISIGSNDYMGGYFGNETMQHLHGPEEYLGMVIGNLTQAIQVNYKQLSLSFSMLLVKIVLIYNISMTRNCMIKAPENLVS